MKPPMCKLCETRHWTYEEHASALEETRELGASVLQNTVTKRNIVTPVTTSTGLAAHVKKAVPKDGSAQPLAPPLGRPRKHQTNAERQRAYRERSK